ncbi:MAG TPA: hypothetical protein VEU33_35830 [Archangium sp.]|nr:hypothetical protein [Archangium sp.]
MHSLGAFRSVLLFSSVACLAASPVGATGNGVWGNYYSGSNFDLLRLRRYDAFIDFWWNTASPDAAYLGADNFPVRWNGGGAWRHEATINGGLTGKTRNHNAGLERTPWGGLSQADKAHIHYTVSCSGTGCSWPGVLCTYDEYSTFATLP